MTNPGQVPGDKTSFLQINLHKKYISTNELYRHFNRSNGKTIGFVQEMYMGKTNKIIIPLMQHKLITYGQGSRAGIIIPKNSSFTMLKQFTTKDQIVLEVRIDNKKLLIMSKYCDIQHNINDIKFIQLIQYCKDNKLQLLAGLDSNSHSTLWGSPEPNQRGKELEETIIQYGLKVHNIGDAPTFIGRDCSTHVDVTLSLNLTFNICNWTVNTDNFGSDHNRIDFDLKEHYLTLEEKRYKIRWSKFRSLGVSCPLPETWTTELLDYYAQKWTDDIISRSYIAIDKNKRIKEDWWNNSLDEHRRENRKLFKKWKSTESEVDLKKYKDHSKQYKKAIFNQKKEHFTEFCEKLNDKRTLAKLTKPTDGSEHVTTTIKNNLGQFTNNDEETLNVLIEAHLNEQSDHVIRSPNLPNECTSADLLRWEKVINMDKLNTAIRSLKPGKAPGPDLITGGTMKNLDNNTKNTLIELFRASVALSYIPTVWKTSKVCFLKKPGKPGDCAKDFRPLTLSSVVYKTLEKLIIYHWETKFNMTNNIHCNQHGFRPKYSTESAISQLLDLYEKAIEDKEIAVSVFVDFSSAFDRVQPDSLHQAFIIKEMDDETVKWFIENVKSRIVQVEYGVAHQDIIITGGVGQGQCISPYGWDIELDTLLVLYDGSEVSAIGYADDVCITIRGICLSTLIERINRALKTLQNWSQARNLSININKTKAMIIGTNKKALNTDPTDKIKLNGQPIEVVTQYKYLGIEINNKMNWTSAVDQKIKTAKQLMMRISGFIQGKRGFKPNNALWIYKQVILPKLTYGSMVWHKLLRQGNYKAKLQAVQRLGMSFISGFFKSSPNEGLEWALNLLPLDLAIKEKNMKSYLRIKDLFQTKAVRGHLAKIQKDINHLGIKNEVIMNLQRPGSFLHWNKNYRISLEQGDTEPATYSVDIYTDGSKTASGVGAGFAIYDWHGALIQTKIIPLPELFTVFHAEQWAILMAADWVINNKNLYESRFLCCHRIRFFSDSRSTLQTLNKTMIEQGLTHDLIKKLNVLSRLFRVELHWTKAHVGTKQNELADKLAKTATTRSSDVKIDKFTLHQLIKLKIKARIQSSWDERFKNSPHMNQTKTMWAKRNHKASKQLLNLDRKELYEMLMLITGHCTLMRHLSLCSWTNSYTCRACNQPVEETPIHLIRDCPKYMDIRRDLLGFDLNGPIPEKWDLSKLLRFKHEFQNLLNIDMVPDNLLTGNFDKESRKRRGIQVNTRTSRPRLSEDIPASNEPGPGPQSTSSRKRKGASVYTRISKPRLN